MRERVRGCGGDGGLAWCNEGGDGMPGMACMLVCQLSAMH